MQQQQRYNCSKKSHRNARYPQSLIFLMFLYNKSKAPVFHFIRVLRFLTTSVRSLLARFHVPSDHNFVYLLYFCPSLDKS